jgi:quercetin dioxygenase-like cupin family protein
MRMFLNASANVAALFVYLIVLGRTPLHAQSPAGQGDVVSFAKIPVKFDKEYGAMIARIGEGRLVQMDATVVEVPPGGKLAPKKLLAEEIIYIVSGKGSTTMWTAGPNPKKVKYDWVAGDVLSPSLNVWREHANASSTEPARFLSMTSAPITRNLFGTVPSSDDVFQDRWNKGVAQKLEKYPDGKWSTGQGDVSLHKTDKSIMAAGHYLPDMIAGKWPAMSPTRNGFNIRPTGDASSGGSSMAGNRLFEWEAREETKPRIYDMYHRHPWEAVYLCVKGEMESRLTRVSDFSNEKLEPERVVTWKAGDLIISESNEYHSHHTNVAGSRFLEFKVSGYFYRVGTSIPLTRNIDGKVSGD